MPHFPPKPRLHLASDPEHSNVGRDWQREAVAGDETRRHRMRIKNRRQRYLDLHPEYFEDTDLQSADPLLYDRLVRRFQSAAEREAEGRARGYAGMLEADLQRAEAKVAAAQAHQAEDPQNGPSSVTYVRDAAGGIVGLPTEDEDVANREQGWQRWVEVMGRRFVRGEDEEFEYGGVDDAEELDDRGEEERRALEEYLRGEEEVFVGDGPPRGQTGVQDF